MPNCCSSDKAERESLYAPPFFFLLFDSQVCFIELHSFLRQFMLFCASYFTMCILAVTFTIIVWRNVLLQTISCHKRCLILFIFGYLLLGRIAPPATATPFRGRKPTYDCVDASFDTSY